MARIGTLLAGALGVTALAGWLLWAVFGSAFQARATSRRAAVPSTTSVAKSETVVPAAVTAAPVAAPPPVAVAPPDDEAQLSALRLLANVEPERAIVSAREQSQLFPHSANASERTSILIHALGATGRASEARGEAESMVNRYPDSSWVREIEAFTGAHRHRTAYLAADGQVAYE